MKKTLVKSKIVLEDNGKSLVTYFWKRTFLWFGYWYPFGSSITIGGKISEEKLSRINDNAVSNLFYDKFIRGFK
jgi:hypothetical protein